MGLKKTKKLLQCELSYQHEKKSPTDWKKLFESDISDKVLVSKIYKELVKLKLKKPNNLIKTRERI